MSSITNPMSLLHQDSGGNALASGVSNPLPVALTLASGATPITAASGNVAAGPAVATLAAAAAKTTYITGFTITGAGATAASVVTATLAGVITGMMSYTIAVPAGANVGVTPLVVQFTTPIPASAVNTAIVLTLPSLGTGNTNAAVTATGYQL